MGFWNTGKKVAHHFVDWRIGEWLGYQDLKNQANNTKRSFHRLITMPKASYNETFEEALARLDLSAEDVATRQQEFGRLAVFFLLLSLVLFSYGLFIAAKGDVLGFLMVVALTLYVLTQAFRYHFWLFQLRNRKLGCTLSEWWNARVKP